MTEFRRARSQTEAVEAIVRSGGTVGYRYAYGRSDSDPRFGQSRFETQRRLLASLFGEGFLAYVVVVDFMPVDDLLNHGASQTGDADLAPLEKLQYVESLNFYRACEVTDAGLKHLEHLTRLRELSLAYPQIAGRRLELLWQFGGLHKLNLYGPWITDTELRQLKYLTGLRQLSLGGTSIADIGSEQLKGLTQLEELDISCTDVSPAGVKKLRDALPRCKIDGTTWTTERFSSPSSEVKSADRSGK